MSMFEHIPERFKKGILVHIALNLIATDDVPVPLIYGIHGAPGDGKTYQCQRVLSENEIESFLISGGELETYQAGEASALIRRTYKRASDAVKTGKVEAAAIVINDVDAAIGDWGSMVQYTVNRQSICSELMHLCDFPTKVGGSDTARIPIIFTGNDFQRLYPPLRRSGRMRMFEWVPSLEETIEIVGGIFSGMSVADMQKLVIALTAEAKQLSPNLNSERLPISFFSDLKSSAHEEIAWNAISNVTGLGIMTMKRVLSSKMAGSLHDFFDCDELIKIGKTLIASGRLNNHLRGANG